MAQPPTGDRTVPTVTLVTKEGCHLCIQAREVLAALQTRLDFQVQEVPVGQGGMDPQWTIQVPVIVLRTTVLSTLHPDPGLLERALRRGGVAERPRGGPP